MARRLQRNEYTVGWICALPDELTAAQEMLDEEHLDLPSNGNDSNIYTLGCIGAHNVVLACLPAGQMGTNSAAAVAMQMKATFLAIRFGLMVGIGGGVPCKEADIRLGDIVVSQPGRGHGGVVQYDFGKSTPGKFERTGFLNTPPSILLAAVAKLRSNHDREKSSLSTHLSKLGRLPKFSRDMAGSDVLFEAGYTHIGENSCASCAVTRQMQREERVNHRPVVHYGTIASGNKVMRDGMVRDQISSELGGVLCFEMEAAGLMNSFPCLVIRGICDYADSHKNKRWQPFAAGTAAAYAKELLLVIPALDVSNMQTIDEGTREHLPFSRNRRFVGRSTELSVLAQRLFINKECQKIALVGLGGAGKTQIALQFAYWVKDNCPDFSIFWMPASSMEMFEQACAEIARALRIPQSQEDIRHAVQQRLSAKTTGKWFLIVDNADDLELLCGKEQEQGLLDFLPESEHGLTLFTTRHYEAAQCVVGNDVLEVAKMERQEAINMLQKSLQRTLLHDDALIRDLLSELDYLPLAITQAAAYINSNRSSISDYLWLLKKTEQDAVTLMSTEFRDNTRYKNSTNAIAKTWTISFNQIIKHDKEAADLLAFISCIEWKAIPYSILPAVQPEARMASAIGTLCSYSFLERRQYGKMFDMHRLVYLATRTWIRQNGSEAETRAAAIKHLSEVFPFDDFENREIWQSYMPHVARMNTNEQNQDTEEKSELCLKIGQCLYVDGRMREAVLWIQKSCEWRDRNLNEDDARRLLSQHALARAYLANGQVKEAVKLLEHVVAIRAKVLAENYPNQLASQHALAEAYLANGQVKEAVKLLERVVAIKAEVLTEDYPSHLASQHALAGAYLANGQVKEAVKLLERVVAIKAEVLTEDYPSRLLSKRVLADYHEDLLGRSKRGKTLVSSMKGSKTEGRRKAVVPQGIPHNDNNSNSASIAISDQSLADQELGTSRTSQRKFS
ncbi:kinesin light chain [Melanomma pulvis-pyrius CBS 109.77]|uniref:Kinesin light chain n=1 Tax=Melanomma pulvis-pyrius CBS 109.77 TaxID=1314802 RepID=A0A6A6WS95_9PLEO|nr:kinesin light chain [Melanomma pulvis-pyrius CBS 109.77]